MSPSRPLPPGAERRRQLRLERRREWLRNGWRLLVLLGLAGGLGYTLLRQGWTLSDPQQVEVLGSKQVGTEQVIEAAGLTFPQTLLSLEPSQVAASLAEALPVEEVRVTRLMAPPRLQVQLTDRQAVARARRRTAQGNETGFVDRSGYWMNSRQGALMADAAASGLLVSGWQSRLRPVLAEVLERRDGLGSDLLEIRFAPDGGLWLRSASLGLVRLGPADAQLPRRLEVLAHLVKTLPAQLKGKPLRTLDLTDPEQPELALKKAPTAKPASP
ncbi:FtsQ-type POTRA domain-containing protein [Cyanobium sp. LEGE 06143]|uniref:cell division protein FtsQ/DivIB n=1 Tax=Cyanobium sp. LEGE 06143 TaxID=945727 RepID=UPI00187FC8F1|nr:FtsQ-type POTRA domain-containing protein [Cyanobium sp. LEGE 06143]